MGSHIKRYSKKYDYSYAFGAFPTIELLKNKINEVYKILSLIDKIRKERTLY